MADLTLNGGTVFPEGTSVGAYPRNRWSVESVTGAPTGSAVASGTISGGSVTFTGLSDSTEYIAYASSPDRYKRFSTPPVSAGSGGGTVGQPQVFVQQTQPSASYPYIWIVTDGAGVPTGEIQSQSGGAVGPVDVDAIQALADAKGDLLVGLADNLLGRVAAGTNGQVLTADSAQTAGLKWAALSLQANTPIPGLVAPGNLVEVTSSSAATANLLRGQRVIAPSYATRLRELWVPIGTASGNLRGAVYDVGATTSAVRTRLFDGASTAAAVGWTLLGDANIAIVPGQHLELTVVADNATVTLGRRSLTGGSEEALPSAVAQVAGCLYKVAWQFAVGSFTNPATLTEGNAGTGPNGVIPMIARVT